MTEANKMKLVLDHPSQGLITGVTPNNTAIVATLLANTFVGQHFLIFETLSPHPTLVNFDGHPDWAGHGNVATSVVADNKAMLDEMLANPGDCTALIVA